MSLFAYFLFGAIYTLRPIDIICVELDHRTDIFNKWEDPTIHDWRWIPTGKHPVYINISVIIDNIFDVNATDMSFKLQFALIQRWIDPRLAYTALPGKEDIPLTLTSGYARKIWVPDTFFANSKTSWNHTNTRPNSYLKVYANGTVLYNMRVTVKTICKMKLWFFPMDVQRCRLRMESYGYDIYKIFPIWGSQYNVTLERTRDFTLTELRLMNVTPYNMMRNLSTGNYPGCEMEFIFGRDLMYFLVQNYIPACIIVVLSWVSFWIITDHKRATIYEVATSRAYIGVMGVLSLILVMNTSKQVLPNVDDLNAVDVYFFVSFVYVLGALLEFIVVHYLDKQKSKWLLKHSRKQNKWSPMSSQKRYSISSSSFEEESGLLETNFTSDVPTRRYQAHRPNGYAVPNRIPGCGHPSANWRDNCTLHYRNNGGTYKIRNALYWPEHSTDDELLENSSQYHEMSESGEPDVWNQQNVLSSSNFISEPIADFSRPTIYRQRRRRNRRTRFAQDDYGSPHHKGKRSMWLILNPGDIDFYSRIFFPLTYVLFNALYFPFYIYFGQLNGAKPEGIMGFLFGFLVSED